MVPSRRYFLLAAGTLGGAALGGLFRVVRGERSSGVPPLRSPGARSEEDFLAACTRCGTCVDSCPGGILRMGLRDLPARDTAASEERGVDLCPKPASELQ